MNNCKNCNLKIKKGHLMSCPNCGAEFCSECAEKTFNICPSCYYSLEIKG